MVSVSSQRAPNPLMSVSKSPIATRLSGSPWRVPRRLAVLGGTSGSLEPLPLVSEPARTSEYARPRLLIVNMVLTLLVIGVMISLLNAVLIYLTVSGSA